MSLLNFPPEITLQIMEKLNLFNRINLSMIHPRIVPLCFDRLLDKKSKKTLTVNELRQLYQQSKTDKERDLCLNSNILDRIRAKNFNEVVHLHMDSINDKFFRNQQILDSFHGKIVLETENEQQFSEDFCKTFISLIDRVEGNILLIFVDVINFGRKMSDKFTDVLSRKLGSGKTVFCLNFCHRIGWLKSLGTQITSRMHSKQVIIYYERSMTKERNIEHFLDLEKVNSGANTEALIGMINEDRFIETKQHLVKVLPLVKVIELQDEDLASFFCENCGSSKVSLNVRILLTMIEPVWSNCASCALTGFTA